MQTVHSNLALGGWSALTLAQQLGNIGSEVGRTGKWQGRDEKLSTAAAERALELIDLTLADSRWTSRLKEIARLREVFCDTVFGSGMYNTSLLDLDRYLATFALAARKNI